MSRPWALLLPLVMALALFGCEINPFCLDCEEGDGDADGDIDADGDGDSDADGDADGDSDGDGDGDGDGDADSCDPEAEEICNGIDDNCNGEIDEGFDLMNDPLHCGRCNNPCILAHAFSACVEGQCVVTGCDVCFHDNDGRPENGCEYACCRTATIEVPGNCEGPGADCCDGMDNDCDGLIDEDHDTSRDPNNCGGCSATCTGAECPFRCYYPFGIAECRDGECHMAGCVEGRYDIDGDDDNGCEYACTPNPETDGVEICNNRDDNCDGEIDEWFEGIGELCGSDVGACVSGLLACVGGRVICEGEVTPTLEVCDGVDNDCDGEIDESDPLLGRPCGTDMGVCRRGIRTCVEGEVVCEGAIEPGVEICNGLDDDCDGIIDNDVPDDGPCGTDEGACRAGTRRCLDGRFVCDGSIGPTFEQCDGIDNDCDGEIDEELFQDCTSLCGVGERECVDGDWGPCSAREPSPEVCDGIDNDCDGLIDNADAAGTSLTRPCSIGDCTGVETCTGPAIWTGCTASVPTDEICDGEDNDCNGVVDDVAAALLATDPSNCGACGRDCRVELPNALVRCVDGACQMTGCLPGFYNIDPAEPGCEYPCVPTGREQCNGNDDDCDGMIDNADASGAPLTRICRNGVCTGIETCTAAAWGGCTARVPTEQRCNGLDDDCDGIIDNGFLVGTAYPCVAGHGACAREGYYECSADGLSRVCNATPNWAAASPEVCDGVDNDCDGLVDIEDPDLTLDRFEAILVTGDLDLDGDGLVAGDELDWSFRIFTYEASHPDADYGDPGTDWSYACSNPDVPPWSSVNWRDAQDACCGLNPSGGCEHQTANTSGGSMVVPRGWALCMATDWEAVCQLEHSPYPYSSSFDTTACNGFDFTPDADCYGAGNPPSSFCLTGAMDGCTPPTSAAHYDMSGNLHEWTWTGWFVCGCDRTSGCDAGCDCDPDCGACACDTDAGTLGSRCQYGCDCDPDCFTFYEYRGGSAHSGDRALRCTWNFNVGADRSDDPDGPAGPLEPEPGLANESIGFRCCHYPVL